MLLGSERADLLREAMAFLRPTYPLDADERCDTIDQLDLDDRLNELDERFFALEAESDSDGRLGTYPDANSV